MVEALTRTDWQFIGIDETSHWHLPAHLSSRVHRILTVFAFNRAEHTYCCEFTPSYWMHCVDYSVQYTREATEEEIAEIEDAVQQVSLSDSDRYYHVQDLDRRIEEQPEWVAKLEHFDPCEFNTEQEVVDYIHDSWNLNPRF